jgi:type II secretory pathway component PulJ
MRFPLQLNKRERIAVYFLLVAVGLLAVVEGAILPLFRYRQSLVQAVSVKTQEIQEIRDLEQTLERIRQRTENIHKRVALREKNFTLFSYLDHSAGNAAVKEHIAYMKPGGSIKQNNDYKVYQVEIKLQSVSLHQLTAFLYEVETKDTLVGIKKAAIARTSQSAQGVDAVLWIETIAP